MVVCEKTMHMVKALFWYVSIQQELICFDRIQKNKNYYANLVNNNKIVN